MLEHTRLLKEAAYYDRIGEVRRLIPISDPTDNESEALRNAISQGHLECAKLLAVVSDAHIGLKESAWHGNVDLVAFFIPLCDPKTGDSIALRWAARHGYLECVELLLPHSDPKANHSAALWSAALSLQWETVDRLWEVSDPWDAISHLQSKHPNREDALEPLERKACEQQKYVLSQHVTTSAVLQRKKM